MRIIFIPVILLAMIPISARAQALTQDICVRLLETGIKDARRITQTNAFRESTKSSLCEARRSSASIIKNKASSLGIDYSDLSRSLGVSATSASSDSSFESEFRDFCDDNAREIVLNTSLIESSDTINIAAINAFETCANTYINAYFQNRDVLITASPNGDYSSFDLLVQYIGILDTPITINSYSRNGDTSCFRDNASEADAPVQNGDRISRNEILKCTKNSSEPVSFTLVLERARPSNVVNIPAAPDALSQINQSISQLMDRIGQLEAKLNVTSSDVNSIGQTVRRIRRCEAHRGSVWISYHEKWCMANFAR